MMRNMLWAGTVVLLLAACQGPGYGVKEGPRDGGKEGGQQAAAAPATASAEAPPAGVPDRTPGFSIWSIFGGNKDFVRKRLDPGVGKSKADQVARLGQPVQCTPDPKGGELCLWHDQGMAEGGTADPSMHQVYYSFDKGGVARRWDYRGVYGKLSSADAVPEAQAPAKQP
jgi:hypothetical protein